MSNSVSLVNGVLLIDANPTQGCHLTAYLVKGGSVINASADNYHSLSVATSKVKAIDIVGGSGSDYIFVDKGITVPVTISGGAGNDAIRGGGGHNIVIEGNGNDWIDNRGSASTVVAGNGNDTILATSGPDNITLGDGNDSVVGGGGSDSIKAGNGNDAITGGIGNVTITAGNGRDTLNSGTGHDILTVGTGASTIITGDGTNTIVLGNASDKLTNYGGHNTVHKATTTGSTGSTGTTTTTGSTSGTGTSTKTTTTTSTSKSTGSTGSGSSSSIGSSSTSTGPDITKSTNAPSAASSPAAVHSSTPSEIGVNKILPADSASDGFREAGGWTAYYAPSNGGTNPQAVLEILAPVSTVGIAIDTKALSSVLGYGSAIDAYYQWNFGDYNGEYNWLSGFNSSHVYTTPGTYTITLQVTNALSQVSSVSANINISGDYRRLVYVNAQTGSDYYNGASPQYAVQSAARADALVTDDTEVLFARGETFNLGQAFKLDHHNVLVGAYGTGAQPVINYTAPSRGSVIFTTNSSAAAGVTVQDLTLTTLNGTQPTINNMPMGVMVGGVDTSVLRCTFDYVEYDINASSAPTGVTVEDNSSPINGGLQGYFLWDQGIDTTVIGNYVNGSVHEHVMRTSSATQILVDGNNFNNYDGKGCIEIHVGSYAWIEDNTVNGGDIRVGPLGLWGEPVTDTTSMCVIEDNHVNNSDVTVFPGAHDISIRNNVIIRSIAQLIDLRGQDSYGRQTSDIRIVNNTGILTGTTGNFLKIENHAVDVLLENNLLSAPSLAVGAYGTAPVFVNDSSLSDFSYIDNNVWQLPGTFYRTAHDGINWVGANSSTSNYQTTSAWNNQPEVGTDYFSNVKLDAALAPVAGSLATYVAQPIQGIFYDAYGDPRSTSGSWAAGAVVDGL